MPEETVPALLIDIEATTVRFALRSLSASGSGFTALKERKVSSFSDKADLAAAISWAFGHYALTGRSVDVMLSVPAPVLGDVIDMRVPSHWSFTKSVLLKALRDEGTQVRRLEAVNDMFTCGLALPGILEARRVERLGETEAAPIDGYPVLLVCARPNIGLCGLAPVPYRPAPAAEAVPVWVPIQAEPGAMPLAPVAAAADASPEEKALAMRIAAVASELEQRFPGLHTAHDFLNPDAIVKMHQVLSGASGKRTPSVKTIASLDHGAEVMEIWSSMFGLWVRSLALAYGARGGIYIFGVTPLTFFTGGSAARNRQLFRKNFELASPSPGYLGGMPTYLVKHDNPFLEGLAQLRLDQE